MKLSFLLLSLILLMNCSAPQKKKEDAENTVSWAIKFADATMQRSDSLIYYLRDKPKYEYDYAFLASAIDKLGDIDSKYSKCMKDYIDYFVQEDGSIEGHKLSNYNIDRVRPGLNMLELYGRTGDEKYKTAIETLITHMEGQPRTNAGGFWHKKMYPYQMWLDGLYMASPFLARYANDFNKPVWFDEVTFQLQEVYKRTLDENTGLIYHAWDESKQQRWCNPETGQSKHFWSRATGWYLMALVDVLDYLPENHSDRPALITILNDLSEALLNVSDIETGLWYQVLDHGGDERNYLEASGTAMFIYAFAKGAKKDYIDKKFLEIADHAFDSMVENMVKTGDDGLPVLTNTCGACGLGGNPYREADYNYYVSEKQVDNDPKGVAPFILAAIELNK
ncbi:glycoside hydrolase family 88 protein [Prolixibacteraceae bacterium Z1-6]|uniref:Glycoside hydrolase family 88 protein n=1 Tax=Draconibacterium aestuarii TaxID=2998507 RepID=A0A9X3J6V3_9BACT|nr:glycoside hydrolase family 88 protein [Prolixibacteraceae bacterium Z1-6]